MDKMFWMKLASENVFSFCYDDIILRKFDSQVASNVLYLSDRLWVQEHLLGPQLAMFGGANGAHKKQLWQQQLTTIDMDIN